jgi:hypothetical protein
MVSEIAEFIIRSGEEDEFAVPCERSAGGALRIR